jgi:hypothetical protein
MKTYYLSKSNRKDKKLMVNTAGGKTIHFGDSKYEDYTIHHDDNRKNLYIIRHQKNEDWNDLSTSGAWSYNLLWSKPSLTEAVKSMERRYSIRIIF